MGYFSEMALNKQEELGLPAEQVSAGNAFEDEETFDELPVPHISVQMDALLQECQKLALLCLTHDNHQNLSCVFSGISFFASIGENFTCLNWSCPLT